MALLNRNSLKNFFKRGVAPTEEHFGDLIDSSVNKVDEGFNITPEEGLILAPQGTSHRVLSVYENIRDKKAAWVVSLNPTLRAKGLSFAEGDGESRLFLQKDGHVGIGTMEPQHRLEVNGTVGMKGRLGTFAVGSVPADGKWHTILENQGSLQAYEVMAEVRGIKGRGRYALIHAFALSTFGRSRHKIRCTQAHFGWFWNKLRLRWKGDVHNYRLEIRTRSSYGKDEHNEPIQIRYRVCRLWNSENMESSQAEEQRLLGQ